MLQNLTRELIHFQNKIKIAHLPARDKHECRGEEQRPAPRELDKVEVEQVVGARQVVRRFGREVADHAQHQGADDVDANLVDSFL